MKCVVLDYGVGNLRSICAAISKVGSDPCITSDPKKIGEADALILPGVGAFEHGMAKFNEKNLMASILNFAGSGRPVMGICLGMQMLFEWSSEFGSHRGIGLLEGEVTQIDTLGRNEIKLPHIGWAQLVKEQLEWSGTIFDDISDKDYFYFIHSFHALAMHENILATADYQGVSVCAAVQKDNIFGCQFHPEKSGLAGLRVLSAFFELKM